MMWIWAIIALVIIMGAFAMAVNQRIPYWAVIVMGLVGAVILRVVKELTT